MATETAMSHDGDFAPSRWPSFHLIQDCLNYISNIVPGIAGAFSSVQFSSVAQSCLALCNPMNRSTPDLPVHHQLPSSLRLTSIESVMPSSHLILCHSLLLLPPIPPSIKVFSSESTLRMRWPKYWSFSFSILPKKSQG